MTDLERQVAALRAQLNALAERVRLDAVAESFLSNAEEIREGDFFLLYEDFPTRLGNISSQGKWTYQSPHGCIEPHQIPEPGEYQRLYTGAEVAEIVAKALRAAAL